jgi:hypothetical protein
MKILGCLWSLLVLGLMGGCATTPRVDWDSRVGNYTYDQAESQLGQPIHHEARADGSQSAEWITERGNAGSVGFGMGAAYSTPGMLENSFPRETPRTPDRYLRLTFGPDGKMTQWQRYYR